MRHILTDAPTEMCIRDSFKEQVGQTYIKYINFVRMEHAKLMLSQGMKVKEIYEQVGFLSLIHISPPPEHCSSLMRS